MTQLHPLLRRQLRRLGLGEAAAPDLASWQGFLERLGQTYRDVDEERYTVERAFEISSREMQDLYEELRRRSEQALAIERDKLAHSLAIQHAALETMRDGVAVIGANGGIVAYNQRILQLFAIPPALLDTDDARANLHHVADQLVDREAFSRAIEYHDAHPTETSEDELALKDGRIVDRFTAPVFGPGGVVLGRMSVFRDITDEIRSQDALRVAKEAAEEATQAKSRFLANMSHELRTPLNAIVGFARVLLSQSEQLSDTHHKYVGYVSRAAEHMLSLVNDLLDLRGLEEGRHPAELAEHDVEEMVDTALSLVAPLIGERGHVFEAQLDESLSPVRCEPRALVQVLVNLLSNAAKYTPPGGTIRLRARDSGMHTCIEVADSGIGIADADLPHLFNYFTQVGAKHRHHMQGSGVGLALTKQLVDHMGGRLEVKSEVDRGSVFRVRIPRSVGP